MFNPTKVPRARLTLPIIGFGLLDIVGMLLFALGAGYVFRGPGFFLATFPSSMVEGIVLTLAGIALMIYAGARLLGETMKQAPRMGSEIDAARDDR